MKETLPFVICSTFVVKENKVVIILCPKFKKWRLPGGLCEDETIEHAAEREVKEEIGISINAKFVGLGQDSDYNYNNKKNYQRLLLFFKATTNEEITLNKEEAEEHKWVTLDELKQLDIEGALKDFFTRNPKFTL